MNGSVVEDPVYPSSIYSEWYQPLFEVSFDDLTPDVSQPTDDILSYHGPDIKDIICETSDASPAI